MADSRHPYATEDIIAEQDTIRVVGSDNLDGVVARPGDIEMGNPAYAFSSNQP